MESDNSPTHVLSPTTVPSPHAQTSSTSSFETFSSAEAGSSETSPSPSPAVSDTEPHTKPTVPSIELSDLSTAEPPPIDPLPSPPPRNQTLKPPTSVPKSLASSSDGTHREPSWLYSMCCKYLNRHVIGNIIGVLSLIATLIGLFVYGHKTYRLAVMAGKSSFLANCQQQVQINRTIGLDCEKTISDFGKGSLLPIYKLAKRVWDRRIVTRDGRVEVTYNSTESDVASARSERVSVAMIMALATVLAVIVGGVVMVMLARKKSESEKAFTSPARFEVRDIQVTKDNESGPETVASGEGYWVVKHNPDEQHYLGQLRNRIRNSQAGLEDMSESDQDLRLSRTSSENTLVGPWVPSKKSLTSKVTLHTTNDEEGQRYEGLIELRSRGDTKNFFNSETGEFIHLAPWKSTQENDEESGDEGRHEKSKGAIKHALAQMAAGATAFAGGTTIDDAMLDELEKMDTIGNVTKEKIPQRAGDCLAGLVTNEAPSGRPTTV